MQILDRTRIKNEFIVTSKYSICDTMLIKVKEGTSERNHARNIFSMPHATSFRCNKGNMNIHESIFLETLFCPAIWARTLLHYALAGEFYRHCIDI